jgi:hypothetical protein
MEPFAKQPHRFNISAAVATCREAHRSPRSGRMKFFGKRLAIYRDARLRPVAPKIFGLWAASSSLTRRRSATSRRNRKISSWSSAIRLSLRLGSSSLRHRCKVMTLTPSVRAISLCSFPCLAKSFACASFVATSTLECRFTLAMAACPAAATSIGFAAQGSIAVFWTSPTNRRRARCTEKPKFPARQVSDRRRLKWAFEALSCRLLKGANER